MSDLKNVKLKVCGLRDNITEVARLHPDYVGFIFYPGSSRYVGKTDIFNRIKSIPESIKKIGVFVDQPVNEVIQLAEDYTLDYVQLHGDESVHYCHQVKKAGVGVIKVFAGNQHLEQQVLNAYEPVIDFFLFDTRLKQHGGNGVPFDWTTLLTFDFKKPLFLSGGVDMDNVENIKYLEGLNIHAIDVNSRFEVKPGLKDIDMIRQLKIKMKVI